MAQLSVNVNKIATLRNSRGGNIPNLISLSKLVLDSGAYGITIHPREDERHITKQDVFELKAFLRDYNEKIEKQGLKRKEFNIEGEPSTRFEDLVLAAEPDQVTLVPVRPGEITSDHGFSLDSAETISSLSRMVPKFRNAKMRVSLFMDPEAHKTYHIAKDLGADRIELYTGPFAHAYDRSPSLAESLFPMYEEAANTAHSLGLGTNAGHDLDTNNLKIFSRLPHLEEVSIGHRLVSRALEVGLGKSVEEYLRALSPSFEV